MTYRFVPRSLGIVLILAGLICTESLHAADVTQWPSKEIPELQILNCYVGTWEVIIASQNVPQTPILKGKSTSKWVLDGRFLEQSGALQAPDGTKSIKVTTLMTYDVEKKSYRMWTFMSNGQSTESEGKWDPATQTMTSVGRSGAKGNIATTTGNFTEAGIEKWKITIADQSGKIVSQMVGKNTRQKE